MHETLPNRGQFKQYCLVGGRVISSTLGVYGPYRGNEVHGKGRYCQHIKKSQDEYWERNGVGTGKYS